MLRMWARISIFSSRLLTNQLREQHARLIPPCINKHGEQTAKHSRRKTYAFRRQIFSHLLSDIIHFYSCWTANNVVIRRHSLSALSVHQITFNHFFISSNINSSKLNFPGKNKKVSLLIWFLTVFIFFSRQHVSNWSMAKENQDPSGKSLNSPSMKSTSRFTQQKSFERTHQSPQHDSPQATKLKSSSDLFELLERCQSQRLDDQRCVLPSYFSQVSYNTICHSSILRS